MFRNFAQLSTAQIYVSYWAVSDRFRLSMEQRTLLEKSTKNEEILLATHNEQWFTVRMLLEDSEII